MKHKWISALLSFSLLISLFSGVIVPASAEEIPDVTKYSYTVTPILSPFCYYLYVKTDNPDPTSFRLVDDDSALYGPDAYSSILIDSGEGYYYSVDLDPGTYYISQNIYPDVVYENEATFRVKGGYIFMTRYAYSDGGSFKLLQKTKSGSSILNDKFEETNVSVSCAPMEDRISYLIKTCTSPDKTFFENMDAVQKRVNEIAIYPRSVYDMNSPSEDTPYPLLAASPYPELDYNQHYSMYHTCADGMLTANAYPFVLDSLGVPGALSTVAEKLEPDCEVTRGSSHAFVNISFGGETRSYGGAGSGGYDPLFSEDVKKVFTFEGAEDLALNGTIEKYYEILIGYQQIAADGIQKYRDLIAGETFKNTIRKAGGSWLKVATEGFFGFGTSFGYAVPLGESIWYPSEAWVDGRYVGKHECIVLNTKFEDHPYADIVLQDVTYTDRHGVVHTQDVLYEYEEDKDIWTAGCFYNDSNWYSTGWELPEELVLTREEVNAMDLDCNSSHLPESGLVYDGQEYPGTPFTVKLVTGVQAPEKVSIYVGESYTLEAVVEPEDAFLTKVTWTSSDPGVVEVRNPEIGAIYGVGEGTAVLTVQTQDGSYTAECIVTVTVDPCAEGHSFKNGKCDICGEEDPNYVEPTEPEVQGVTRVFGADRYATSFKAADTLKAELGVNKFQNIIVASGTGFADALAGSYLAAVKEAPILLVKGSNVNAVKDYIKQNLTSGGTVYLLGGVNAVPKTMESGLDGFNVKRLGGADRYETNLLILKEAGVGNKDIIVCTGLNFADSLSASASGLPILLVKGGLTNNQKNFLASTSGKKIIVGGTSAVSGTVEKQLASYGSVKRLAGATRYDTSVLVAKEFFLNPTSAVLAYAQNFPDGLSGGPLAYTLKAPLILTDNKKPTAAVNYATGLGIKSGYVLGGTGLISDKVAKNIFSMRTADTILVK